MRKIFVFGFSVFTFLFASSQQQVLLYTETFDNGPSGFLFDSGGVSTNSGSNIWIINNSYSGHSVYPDTPPEDSVDIGQINGAPYSNYLHIHDSVTLVDTNANWNTNTASDRFTYLGNSFCTLGINNVAFSFFWICEGDSNAYGQVYYRVSGGNWIQTGQPKYFNQSKWKYEVIQDSAFSNVPGIQFGFRWVNQVVGGTSDIGFGIDDIIAAGIFDSLSSPFHMSVTLLDTLICQGDPLYFTFTLSHPVCDASYDMQMSDAIGSFSNPHYLGTYTFGSYFTSGTLATLGTPGNMLGSCVKFRVIRSSPQPVLISDTSVCFSIIVCPNQIFNIQVPMLNDIDTACILSEIDVRFNSLGVYHNGNTYIAELSDSTGNFVNSSLLGQLALTDSFPSMPPGNISGLILASVPPGCNYYVRVRSTNPVTYGAPVGPYCLAQCDELTNNHTDLHNCVQSGPYYLCDTIQIHPHQWNNNALYDTCNNWIVELRSMMDFSLVNSGGLAVYHNNAGGSFILCMPPAADSLPVAPGSYYMRIVSSCSNQPWNQTGTVIRITVGAPNSTAPLITLNDSVFCNSELVDLYISPFNHPPSVYQWTSNLLNFGLPFDWGYDPLQVALNNVTTGTYRFYIREINFGCYGPLSAPAIINVMAKPNVNITGPSLVCIGDTAIFQVGFIPRTYYDWSTPANVTLFDQGNNQVRLVFNATGNFTIKNTALNACGTDSNSYTVNSSTFSVTVTGNDTVCLGHSDTLKAVTGVINKLLVTKDTLPPFAYSSQGAIFNLMAHSNVTIDSFAVQYLTSLNVKAAIYDKRGSYITFEQTPASWTKIDSATFTPAAGQHMTVIPINIRRPMLAGDTFAFYVTTTNTGPFVKEAFSNGTQQGAIYASDSIIDFIQGISNQYPFGTFIGPEVLNMRIYYTLNGLSYLWNTGDTSSFISFTPPQAGIFPYSVVASERSGCKNGDSVNIYVQDCTNGIKDVLYSDAITITPNPSSGELFLEGTNNSANIEMCDLNGNKVFEARGGQRILDISNLQDGVYLISVTSNNKTHKQKIVLIR